MPDKIEVPFIRGQSIIRHFRGAADLCDFLNSKEAQPGIFIMYNGWPHVIVDAGEQGKKVSGMRPPYNCSFVY